MNEVWLEQRHQHGALPLAIEVEGRYIGDVDWDVIPSEHKAELTVFLGDRNEWGKRYGTEAAQLIIAELLGDQRVRFIEVDVAPGNTKALAFWRKLGFSQHSVDEQGRQRLRHWRAEAKPQRE